MCLYILYVCLCFLSEQKDIEECIPNCKQHLPSAGVQECGEGEKRFFIACSRVLMYYLNLLQLRIYYIPSVGKKLNKFNNKRGKKHLKEIQAQVYHSAFLPPPQCFLKVPGS